MTESSTWLLLLYGLPEKSSTARVSLWRKLKKFGAVQLKTSAYILPDAPAHYERFQWLATQIRDDGGDATMMRVAEIEGLQHEEIAQLFNAARDEDYKDLMTAVQKELKGMKKGQATSFDLGKFKRRFQDIQEVDYFKASKASDVQGLLDKAETLVSPASEKGSGPLLSVKDFQERTWLTRPRPGIDRVGSAWLIRKFIDLKAKFVFGTTPRKFPGALPFDMADVEFSHHGDDCSFETLIKRFGISDPAVQQIGEMIHDADIEDEKFHRVECFGLNAVFQGWAKMGLKDDEILNKGGQCFDALYHYLGRKS